MKKTFLLFIILIATRVCFSQGISFEDGSVISVVKGSNNAKNFLLSSDLNSYSLLGVYFKALDKRETIDENAVADINIARLSVLEKAILKDGFARVRYNQQNGIIKKGDLISISSEPGVGAKAVASGMVVGIALEDTDPKLSSGLVEIRVLIQYVKF